MNNTNFGIYRPPAASKSDDTGKESEDPVADEDAAEQLVFNNLVAQIEDKESVMPNAAVKHFLRESGCDTSDERILSLIGWASQKFISDVVDLALKHNMQGTNKQEEKGKKIVLTGEDIAAGLSAYDANDKK